MPNILITGASSGIGYATSQYLLAKGYHVFGSIRREADGKRLQQELGPGFTPLFFDVRDEAAVLAAASQVEPGWGTEGLAGLINNAGISVSGPLQHVTQEELRQQFEVNVFGVMNVTRAFLPLLGARANCPHPPGRIIHISSVSGRITFPFLGPYCASKHALESLADALRRELLPYGIDVVSIQPGAVRTPIWEKAAAQPNKYQDTDYAPYFQGLEQRVKRSYERAIPPEEIARAIGRVLEQKRPPTRIVVAHNPWMIRLLSTFMPDRWLDAIAGRRLKRIRER